MSIILRDNFISLSGAVLTYTGFDASAPGTNLSDDKAYEVAARTSAGAWEVKIDLGDGTGGTPGPLKPNALALINQNPFSDGSDVILEWSNVDAGYTAVTLGAIARDGLYARYGFFVANAHRWWKIRGTAVASIAIGQALLGRAVVFPQGVDWPGWDPLAYKPKGRQVRAQLGSELRQAVDYVARDLPLKWSALDASFLTDDTVPTGFRYFRDTFLLEGYPFLFWDQPGNPGTQELEAIWCTLDLDRGVRQPMKTGLDNDARDLLFSIRGKKD